MATPSIFTMSSLTSSLPPITQCTRRRLLAQQQLRYKSTTRRMTKALRLHPHGSFIGTASTMPSRSATSRNLPAASSSNSVLPTIIHNPPSAAPTPYITPRLFVPRIDPRYEAPSETAILKSSPPANYAAINPRPEITSTSTSSSGEESTATATTTEKLPPALSRPYQKTYHLNEADIKKIQQLRGQNPDVYTRNKLAKMFGCSEFFVGMVAPTTEDRKKEMRKKEEGVRAGWGKIRSFAREERGRRRELWSKDL
ncbi:hypothetical protein TWF106_004606 [Orbilia oligospora]|uniref:Mitochondrial ribosomal protein subunit L20-domain-containing protein n=1 Tax=Orbilia oligospora TaxID=2813651 RepID=A0A6G1M1G2_ORBOL|nr:hypothetical protein TWF106_004606 [Orbilia oligospora]KAF3208537.1 hypothetical protein TWF191_000602 [Orbilia oligospora]KAF3240876.1 hypothetical protein TWF192_009341 [Orbilia oligospora]